MTSEELAERRRKELCFHCNDKFGPGHVCKKLFMIEACWEEADGDVVIEAEETINEPKILFHAMAGFQSPTTMRI